MALIDSVADLLESTPQQACKLPNGETIMYREFNKGAPHRLVFIPGYISNADIFAAALFSHADMKDHHIIAVNPRGYNGSTNNESAFSHEANADDVKLFLDTIGIETAMAIGYSTGGATVAMAALKYPETITAGFLLNSVPLNGFHIILPPDETCDSERHVRSKEDAKTFVEMHRKAGLASSNIDEFYAAIAPMTIRPDTFPSIDHSFIKAWHLAALLHVSRVEAQYSNATFNITPIMTKAASPSLILEELKVPLIVLHGENDYVADRAQAKAVTDLAIAEKWAPDNLISYYEHPGGHFPFTECPEELVATYRKAFDEKILAREAAA